MATNRKDIPQHYYTFEEYFALEKASEARFEYWDGEIVCMTGGSRAHSLISSNVLYRLRRRLEGKQCAVFGSDLPILTPALQPYRYPDVTVGCGELKVQKIHGVEALTNPTVIFEVLSPTTVDRDRNQKFKAYKAIPSVADYILIVQDAPQVTHYSLQSNDAWSRRDLGGTDAVLTILSLDCTLPLNEIYEGVQFDPD